MTGPADTKLWIILNPTTGKGVPRYRLSHLGIEEQYNGKREFPQAALRLLLQEQYPME
jgi:hypothetical protein